MIMKKLITTTLLLMMCIASFSQQTAPPELLTKEEYLKKSRGQRTAGAILLVVGPVCYMIGTVTAIKQATDDITRGIGDIIDPSNPDPPAKNNSKAISILFFTGTVAIVAGIPLLIAGGKNKRKAQAASVSFK